VLPTKLSLLIYKGKTTWLIGFITDIEYCKQYSKWKVCGEDGFFPEHLPEGTCSRRFGNKASEHPLYMLGTICPTILSAHDMTEDTKKEDMEDTCVRTTKERVRTER